MTASTGRPSTDEDAARRAREVRAADGSDLQPDPDAASSGDARRVQPGFEDVPPGIVPDMKKDAEAELGDEPKGRFASQIDDLPETKPSSGEAAARSPGSSRSDPKGVR